MLYSQLIARALEVSAKAHEGQFRKPNGKIPYVSHCAAVGFILQRAGYPDEVVAAGVLHDVLEDTNLTHHDLVRQFGDEVTELVDLVTEQDKSLPWDVRKQRYRKRIQNARDEARAISAADKLHNIASIVTCLRNEEPIFARMSRGPKAQIEEWERLLDALSTGWESPLLAELRGVIDEVKSLVG